MGQLHLEKLPTRRRGVPSAELTGMPSARLTTIVGPSLKDHRRNNKLECGNALKIALMCKCVNVLVGMRFKNAQMCECVNALVCFINV